MTQPHPSPPARGTITRGRERGLVAVAGLLAVAVAVTIGMVVGANEAEGAAASAPTRPTPGSSSPVTPIVPVVAEPAPVAAVAIPEDCAGIYVRDWAAELAPLVLNPAWTEDRGAGPFRGSSDPVAAAELVDATRLTCVWAAPEGGGDLGVFTDVAALSPDEEGVIVAHLADAGFDCYAELEGTRCIVEWNVEAGASGESHFLRQGAWVATRWSNVSPDGYTHDIVAALFG